MTIQVVSNRGLSGGAAGINPSYTSRFFSGFGAVEPSVDQDASLFVDEASGFDDGSNPTFYEDITVVAPKPAAPVPSRPFDLGSGVSSVLSFLANGLQATSQSSQQAALLAAQQRAMQREQTSAGAWVGLGIGVLASAGVIYWIWKG